VNLFAFYLGLHLDVNNLVCWVRCKFELLKDLIYLKGASIHNRVGRGQGVMSFVTQFYIVHKIYRIIKNRIAH